MNAQVPAHASEPSHARSLEQAKKASAWILKNVPQVRVDRRGSAVMAMHDQVLEHHVGLVALAEHGIFGPAIALLRPIVEGYLRGVWLERLSTPEAVARFLGSEAQMDAAAMLHVLHRTDRLGDAAPLLAAWEASPLHKHPFLAPELLLALPAEGQLDTRFVPRLDEVIDTLVIGTGIALLSTMKIAVIGGEPGLLQAARFRLQALANPMPAGKAQHPTGVIDDVPAGS